MSRLEGKYQTLYRSDAKGRAAVGRVQYRVVVRANVAGCSATLMAQIGPLFSILAATIYAATLCTTRTPTWGVAGSSASTLSLPPFFHHASLTHFTRMATKEIGLRLMEIYLLTCQRNQGYLHFDTGSCCYERSFIKDICIGQKPDIPLKLM